jgi:hypothetical protein
MFKRRHGIWYAENTETRDQFSLRTRDKAQAARLLNARNDLRTNAMMNREIAKVHLRAADPEMEERTWAVAMALPPQNVPKHGGLPIYVSRHACVQRKLFARVPKQLLSHRWRSFSPHRPRISQRMVPPNAAQNAFFPFSEHIPAKLWAISNR